MTWLWLGFGSGSPCKQHTSAYHCLTTSSCSKGLKLVLRRFATDSWRIQFQACFRSSQSSAERCTRLLEPPHQAFLCPWLLQLTQLSLHQAQNNLLHGQASTQNLKRRPPAARQRHHDTSCLQSDMSAHLICSVPEHATAAAMLVFEGHYFNTYYPLAAGQKVFH